MLVVGPRPSAPALPHRTSAQVTLTALKQDLRHGVVYPVVFGFARAGEVRVQLPIALPSGSGTASGDPTATGAAQAPATTPAPG